MSVPTRTRTYKCRACFKTNDFWDQNCPSCGAFGGLYLAQLGPPPSPKRSSHPTLADAPDEKIERVPTGIPEVDRIFGTDETGESGIPIPSISLFAGGEGGGKTTLWLQIAAACRRQIILLSTEQTVKAIRHTAVRIGMSEATMRRMHVESVKSLADALKLIRKWRTSIVVIDSLSEMSDPDHDTGDSYTNTVRTLQTLKEETERRNLSIICMVQLNNDDAIAGLRKLRHLVDAVFSFESIAEGDLRLLHAPRKNRLGKTGVRSWFMMTGQGLVPCTEPDEETLKKSTPKF